MNKKELRAALEVMTERHRILDGYAKEQRERRITVEQELAALKDADARTFLGDYAAFLRSNADYLNAFSVLLLGRTVQTHPDSLPNAGFPIKP